MAQVTERETHIPVRAKPRARTAVKWVFAAVLLGAIAVGAALYPARRAASIDPIEVLRYEAGG